MKSTREKVSYCLGLETGRNLQRQFNDMDVELLRKGFEDAIANNNPKLNQDEIQSIMQALKQQVETQQRQFYAKLSEQNRQEGENYLENNKYFLNNINYNLYNCGTNDCDTYITSGQYMSECLRISKPCLF